MTGSLNLRRFRIAIRAGRPVAEAASLAGIGLAEARLTIADDARNPPPADAYAPLGAEHCGTCAAVLCECSDLAWRGIAA